MATRKFQNLVGRHVYFFRIHFRSARSRSFDFSEVLRTNVKGTPAMADPLVVGAGAQ